MKPRNRNIAVGLTTLGGIVGLAILLLLFGYLPQWLQDGYELTIHFPTAEGVHEDSRVTLNGIEVGRVTGVELAKPAEDGVIVEALINQDIRLPEGTGAELRSPLLGGSTRIALVTDNATADRQLPTDGSAQIHGYAATAATRFAQELRRALAEPMQQFASVSERIEQLSVQWTELGKNLTELTEFVAPELVDGGEAAPTLATVIARADARLAQLQTTLDGFNRYLNNDQLYQNVVQTAENANEVTGATREAIDTVVNSVEELKLQYVALADRLAAAVEALRDALEKARSGDGTVGKLLNDSALYHTLTDTVERVNTAMDQLQIMFETWREEGIELSW